MNRGMHLLCSSLRRVQQEGWRAQFVAVQCAPHTIHEATRDRKASGLGGHCVIFELRMISQYLYHLRVESVFRRRHSSSTRSRVRASERQSVVREAGKWAGWATAGWSEPRGARCSVPDGDPRSRLKCEDSVRTCENISFNDEHGVLVHCSRKGSVTKLKAPSTV